MKEKYGFCECPMFVKEGTILVLGQSEGEGGFGYEWLKMGGEVRLYGVKYGDSAVVVDAKGRERGVLEISENGALNDKSGVLKSEGCNWNQIRFGC